MTHHTMPCGTFALVQRGGVVRQIVSGPTHSHADFELTYVPAGELEFELADGSLRAEGGSCLLMPPEVMSTPRWRAPRIHQVLIARDLFEEAADGAATPRSAVVADPTKSVSAIARAIALEAPAGASDPAIEALVHALVLAFVRVPRAERVCEPGIRRALAYIAEHHGDALRIDDLARVAEMSRFVLLRKFTAQVGESPYRYLTGVRLDRAAEQLKRTKASVLAIALESGFGDPSRFARAFTRRFGCTPRSYRARSA